MKEHIDYLSTLFVGIDIASCIHVISALDFNQDFFIKMKPFENMKEGTGISEKTITDVIAISLSMFHWHGIYRLLWSSSG